MSIADKQINEAGVKKLNEAMNRLASAIPTTGPPAANQG